jgi:inorganic pyrophosphatase
MNRFPAMLLPLVFLCITASCATFRPGSETEVNLLHDVPAFRDDGLVNMVVEIPAGHHEKWQISKQTGRLEWEQESGRGRIIHYLPYPANYGTIPRTWLSPAQGGDGDPLDVFLLGPAAEQGSIQPVRLIGLIAMLDDGEQDDKLLAVAPGSWFGTIESIEALERRFPGVIRILTTWLASYKGTGVVEIKGLEGADKALESLETAAAQYAQGQR